jgi:hypothetical protein
MFSLKNREEVMRITAHPEGRFLGFVQVQVASRVYSLPVKALPFGGGEPADQKPGFFVEGTDRLGIVVDANASDVEQRETIERASAAAAQHISRKVLN